MMNDDTGNKKEVLYFHTNVAHKTLGVMLAPDYINNQHVKKNRQLAQKSGDKVRVGFIRVHDV